MNKVGRVLITDPGTGRIWEAEPDLPTQRYDDVVAPEMEAVFEDMRSTLDPVRRRTPKERLQATMQPIVEQALASYKATGKIIWPRSAELALGEIARLTHDPSLVKDTGGVEQVIKQGQALARYIADTGVRQQAAQDYKKVTLDWAGH